jgi:hypothetical protein
VSFAKFLFLPSWFAKLLEANFSCFAKIIWMPSCFAKLLELLWDDSFPNEAFCRALAIYSIYIIPRMKLLTWKFLF